MKSTMPVRCHRDEWTDAHNCVSGLSIAGGEHRITGRFWRNTSTTVPVGFAASVTVQGPPAPKEIRPPAR